MKATATQAKAEFRPVTVTVTIDCEEQADALRFMALNLMACEIDDMYSYERRLAVEDLVESVGDAIRECEQV